MSLTLNIPDCSDFMAFFGCECNIDENLKQNISFTDINSRVLRLRIGIINKDISFEIYENEDSFFKFYSDGLLKFEIDSEGNSIKMRFSDNYSNFCIINVWPYIKVDFSRLCVD